MSNQATNTAQVQDVTTAQDFVASIQAAMPELDKHLGHVRQTVQNWTQAASVFTEREDLVAVLQGMVDAVDGLRGLSVERFVKYLKLSSQDVSITWSKKEKKHVVKIKKGDEFSYTPDVNINWWSVDPNHKSGESIPADIETALKGFLLKRQKAGDDIASLTQYFTQDALNLAVPSEPNF